MHNLRKHTCPFRTAARRGRLCLRLAGERDDGREQAGVVRRKKGVWVVWATGSFGLHLVLVLVLVRAFVISERGLTHALAC